MVIKLMPHQQKAILEMRPGSILKGDVGTGKSITSIVYYIVRGCKGMPKMMGIDYRPMQDPKDLYIITTAKKRNTMEWELDAGQLGIFSEPNKDGVKLNVDSWNNISRFEDVKDAFFIFDEQRLVGSGAWVKSFLKIAKNNQWIILSATPGDTWMDYIPVFVANGFYKNRSEFLREHVVFNRFSKFPKVDRFVDTNRLYKQRAKVLVEMPYDRHTTRHERIVPVEYDVSLYDELVKSRFNPETQEPFKDVAEFFAYCRKITNLDLSRYGEILKVLEKHPRLIIFYNFNYELDVLRTLKTTLDYPMGEWNGQKHEPVPDGDKWIYLVQYTAGAEGWNCITTDAIAFYSLPYSWKGFHQAKGRIDRLNTEYVDLYYYILRSQAPIDKAIWNNLMGKKSFNEKEYAHEVFGTTLPFEEEKVAA